MYSYSIYILRATGALGTDYHLVGSEADNSSVKITGGCTVDFDRGEIGWCVKFHTGI